MSLTAKGKEFTKWHIRLLKFLRKAITDTNVWLLRRSNGRLGNSFLGVPVLLLTTIGRKSGKTRTHPLYYLQDSQRIILVASNAGTESDPAWLLNIRVNPEVTIQMNGGERKMTARVASAVEKEVLWPKLTALFGKWQMMEERSARTFPVVILDPPDERSLDG